MGIKSNKKLKQWRDTQTQWNDDAFLSVTANAFMKLRWRRLNRRAAALLAQPGAKADLVDLGCAHADFYGYAQASLKSYTGIEPSKALLPKNVRRGASFRLLRGSAEKLPLKAASADFVLLKEVLDHCYDPLKVMQEARRVLRPGGRLLITLTNDAAWYKRLLPGRAGRIKSGQHDHLYFFKPDEVLNLARQAGFKRLELRDSHYLRLPYAVESLLGSLPEFLGSALISFSDALGELLLPASGGSFWVLALK
jgi:SAM-dependent methyltransferase